ncbi:MAG TPA: DUF2911 domain-containing protein [Terracidiphilus sp.]
MKRLLLCTGLLAATVFAVAQKPAASPAEKATATIGGHTVTIDYSAPSVKGREGKIFNKGGLIQTSHKQYPIWRAGANAATTLTTDGTIKVGDISVPAGKYTLFVDVSDPDNWVLIVNKKTGEWGLAYDGSQDLGKTKMEMSKPMAMVEQLKYTISDGKLTLAWENHEASVPITAQ